MIATIIPDAKKHYPVLLNELISIITPQYGGTFIDCTFGQGGYTKKILKFPDTKVIGIDREKAARFSFIMVIPLIFGSMAKSIIDNGIIFENFNLLSVLPIFIYHRLLQYQPSVNSIWH